MANPTMLKFGYPGSLIREYAHWAVLLRPAQVTLGSLVLAARSEAQAFADLEPAAFAELAVVIPEIEKALSSFTNYERINYLMLMMVDREVHFHVIPRYSQPQHWNGIELIDHGWPGPPQLKVAFEFDPDRSTALRDALRAIF